MLSELLNLSVPLFSHLQKGEWGCCLEKNKQTKLLEITNSMAEFLKDLMGNLKLKVDKCLQKVKKTMKWTIETIRKRDDKPERSDRNTERDRQTQRRERERHIRGERGGSYECSDQTHPW